MTELLEEGIREFNGTVHDVDEAKHEVVVEFPHEVMDSYKTDWAQHCFRDSFGKALPVMLWNHNPNELIGHATSAESLGSRSRIVNQFSDFDSVPRAKQAFAQIRDGDVPGFSFHFRNAKSIAHPTERGARRFTQADMLENSPVTFPSIPGAQAVGIRAEEAILSVPTLEELMNLQKIGVLNEDGLRSAVAEHFPTLREHIVVADHSETARTALFDHIAALAITEEGIRDMSITIDSDGTVSSGPVEQPDEDRTALIRSADLCLDSAVALFEGIDVTVLPDDIQQGIANVQAASVAVDELQDVMGIEDPDGDRAAFDAADLDKLSTSDFAYIDSKGGKHLPINDAAHVRNALARFDQTQFDSTDDKSAAMAKIQAAAKKFGVDSGKRDDHDAEIAATLEKLNRRVA